METLRDTKQPDGVQFYLDGQPWDGKIHTESLTPEQDPTEFAPEETLRAGDTAELTLTIEPEQAAAIVEALKQAFEEVARKLREFNEWASEVLRNVAAATKKAANDLMDRMLYAANDNPKWWHLYKHAKKYRTRKKYRRLLMKQLLRKLEAARE